MNIVHDAGELRTTLIGVFHIKLQTTAALQCPFLRQYLAHGKVRKKLPIGITIERGSHLGGPRQDETHLLIMQ